MATRISLLRSIFTFPSLKTSLQPAVDRLRSDAATPLRRPSTTLQARRPATGRPQLEHCYGETEFTVALQPGVATPWQRRGRNGLSYAATGQPTGLNFNDSTRILAGTPTVHGLFTITYTVTDADGDSNSEDFTITVDPDLKPTLNAIGGYTARVGSPFSEEDWTGRRRVETVR